MLWLLVAALACGGKPGEPAGHTGGADTAGAGSDAGNDSGDGSGGDGSGDDGDNGDDTAGPDTADTGCTSDQGALSGTIFRDELMVEPQADARVTAYAGDDEIQTVADDSGAYSFPVLTAGSWSVAAESPDGSCSNSTGYTAEVTPCGEVTLDVVIDACLQYRISR
jgi:hypothetical protein